MHPVYESSSTLWRARKNPKVGQSSLISNFVKTICSIRHDVSEGYDSILFSWVDIKFLWWLLHRHYGSFFQFNAIFQGFRCKLLFVTCLHFFQISSRDCWLVVICLHFKSRSLIGWSLFTFLTERNLIGLQNRSCFLFHFWEFFFFHFSRRKKSSGWKGNSKNVKSPQNILWTLAQTSSTMWSCISTTK